MNNPDPEQVAISLAITQKAVADLHERQIAAAEALTKAALERQRQQAEENAQRAQERINFQKARNAAPICQNCAFFINQHCHAQLPEVAHATDAAGFSSGSYASWPTTDQFCRCSLFERKAETQKRSCLTCKHWHERFSNVVEWPISPENPGIRTCTAIPRPGGKFPQVNAENFCGAWEPEEKQD